MVPGPNAAALKHDHTEKWSYVKVPHRAVTMLERRLGEVASLSGMPPAYRSSQCRPEGTLDLSSGRNWP